MTRMANRTPQTISRTGVAPTYNAAASGDTVTPGDGVFLHVKNGSGGSVTLTLTTTETVAGLAVANEVITIAAGAESVVGPIVPGLFANATDGFAHMAWSATTTVTWAAFTL